MSMEDNKKGYKATVLTIVLFLAVFLFLHFTKVFQSRTMIVGSSDSRHRDTLFIVADSAASHLYSSTSVQAKASTENIYWLFSSSAQAISAFVAFLLTGFALVYTMMDKSQQSDDTLEEIHAQLMREYYRRIKLLSSLTGLAVLLSLAMVYLNGIPNQYNSFLMGATSIVNVAAIVGGILFVISIINPDKYRKVARELIKEEQATFKPTGTTIQEVEFIKQFIKLETYIRDILRSQELYVRSLSGPRMSFSVRQMVEALYHNELIDRNLFDDLIEINKYRNLVFHGHETKVDKGMLDKVNQLLDRLKQVTGGQGNKE